VNNNIEDGALIIIADPNAHYTFAAAARAQITKNVDIYDMVVDSYGDEYHLQYSDTVLEKVRSFPGYADYKIAEFIEDFSKKYEHIYYIVGIPSCGDMYSYNAEILNNYDIIEILNQDTYLDVSHAKVRVHKIK
jgi:hypothetical protein